MRGDNKVISGQPINELYAFHAMHQKPKKADFPMITSPSGNTAITYYGAAGNPA
jgi:hypothetical protein